IDRGHAASGLRDHGPVRAEVDERGENAAVGIAPLRIDHPFLAPTRFELDTVLVQRDDFEPEPLVVRPAAHQLLHALAREFLAHHGTTTPLPMTSRSWMRRSPSRACSSGNPLSITGRILPAAISAISALRSSS